MMLVGGGKSCFQRTPAIPTWLALARGLGTFKRDYGGSYEKGLRGSFNQKCGQTISKGLMVVGGQTFSSTQATPQLYRKSGRIPECVSRREPQCLIWLKELSRQSKGLPPIMDSSSLSSCSFAYHGSGLMMEFQLTLGTLSAGSSLDISLRMIIFPSGN